MKVLGRSTSGNVQKVLFLLEELGVEYTREDYGRQFGNTGTAEYLAMNPTGKVPTLVDDDLTIWESNTILRYIAAKAGTPLYPSEIAARTRIERWMDWLLASVNDSYMAGFKATKAGDPVPDGAATTLAESLAMMDRELQGKEWLAGSDISIADICLAPIVHRCLGFAIPLPDLTNVRAWHDRLSARPAFQRVVG